MMNLNSTVNATIQNMNLTAMQLDDRNSLIRNTTQDIIDALPKCDIETFLTEVGTVVISEWVVEMKRFQFPQADR